MIQSWSEEECVRDRVRQRDEHEHGARYPENCADSAARKTRRAMNQKAEPGKQQDGEDTGDDDAFAFLHG